MLDFDDNPATEKWVRGFELEERVCSSVVVTKVALLEWDPNLDPAGRPL
ncbi:hypothetical protein [Natronorubrum sp. FCH18a]